MDTRNDKPGRRQRLDRAAAARITAAVRGSVLPSDGGVPVAAPQTAQNTAWDKALSTAVAPAAPAPVTPAVGGQNPPAAPQVARIPAQTSSRTFAQAPATVAPAPVTPADLSRALAPAVAAMPDSMAVMAVMAAVRRGRAAPRPPVPAAELRRNWQALREVAVDAGALERNLVITAARAEPAHAAFDVLRTKMMQAISERGWRRVAITSPTKGCGKSFTALNLAVAFSRYQSQRTVLLDLDLRQPVLSRRLGVAAPGAIGDMLRGKVAPQSHLVRFGDNPFHIGPHVALGLNDRPEVYAAETFLDAGTSEVLARIEADYAPDVMLFDMPPALAHDDAIALKAQFDCVLMVVGGGVTTPRDLRESVQRLGEDMPILGMVLNKADGVDLTGYSY